MSAVDGFVGAIGNTPLIRLKGLSEETGCEILGKAEYMNPGGSVKDRAAAAIVADAERRGTLAATGSGSITEGIGIARVTANLEGAPIDDAVLIEDPDTVRCVYRLLYEEGLFLGSTSGINVAAALRVARELGPGHVVVTVLCDGGGKYQSRVFNREWLEQKGLAACAVVPAGRTPITLKSALVA